MALFSSDLMVDRRRLRRQVLFWRVATFFLIIGIVLGIGLAVKGSLKLDHTPHIARIEIEGMITGKNETLDLIKKAQKSGAKAVILHIDSGGGTTAGSEKLYLEIKTLADSKPVIAVIDNVGASGAYMASLGAHRIYATGSAIVGSIGVIAQVPNVSKLLDTLGVKVEAVRSSPLKAMPSGVEPTSPEARAALEATVMETYRWFTALVGERRHLEGAALAKITDGRVFTGRQALELKLIDALGGEKEAITWLESEKKITQGLEIRNYKPEQNLSDWNNLTSLVRVFFGSSDYFKPLFNQSSLDGLLSIWQPSQQ